MTRALHNGYRPGKVAAEDAVRTLLSHLGYDTDAPEIVDTPARVVRAMGEMTAGQWMDAGEPLERVFAADNNTDHDEVIAVKGIEFASMCEHHLMPFWGTITVAYIPAPGASVVGLSKLARLVDIYARRLTMQERLTRQVTTALDANLVTLGSACIVDSRHGCMGFRGVRKHGAQMVTSSVTGLFKTDPKARGELLALTGR